MGSTPETARARARAEVIAEIKAVARSQVAERGAAALSVRHVARELGMSSSGVYRYFASRDDLLTVLIIDAYNALGEAVETAEAAVPREHHLGRWFAAASAVRAWAQANPQEFGLVFGSPVPGYVAPQDTVQPASRVPLTLAAILRDTWQAKVGTTDSAPVPSDVIDATLSKAAEPLSGLPDDIVVQGILAWVELFGLITFELFGHLVGSVADPDEFFRIATHRIASSIGINSAGRPSPEGTRRP